MAVMIARESHYTFILGHLDMRLAPQSDMSVSVPIICEALIET